VSRLQNRIAWITGAGTGIGRGIAVALAEAGMNVALSGRRQAPLDEVAEVIRSMGREAVVLPIDVMDREGIQNTVKAIEESLGEIWLLVNNAGMNTTQRMAIDMAPEDWDAVVDVNLTGAFNCFRGVFAAMKSREQGMVINIASMAGRQISLLGGAAYTASKHAMVALTHSINLEAAAFGIRASVICPGEVDTPILAVRPNPVSAKRQSLMLKPEDLGATVAFVAQTPPHVTIPELWILPTYQVSADPLP
jgi:NADP-dependent 3-hydroxy acid dehydrogenase YdfG